MCADVRFDDWKSARQPLASRQMPTPRPTQVPPVLAWIDGEISPAESPALSALDQAYLSGMGAFETLRAENGMPMFLDAHYERLIASAACFQLATPDLDVVRRGIEALLGRQELESARIRITISGVIATDGTPFRFGGRVRTTILAFPIAKVAAKPLRILAAPFRMDSASPLAGHKCTSYALHALAMHHARAAGCDDALMLNHYGHLIGCATANLFWVKNGNLFTPDTGCGCRNGVTRERVIGACRRLGLCCTTTRAQTGRLIEADEVFTTSSIRGVAGVVEIDGNPIPCAGVGERVRAAL